MGYGKYRQGKYKPENPEKYVGDHTNIVYRSSWELTFMKYCDSNTDIVRWQSEELVIPYISPVDNRPHRYFPDFLIKTSAGEVFLIEIKPKAQTVPPKPKKKLTPAYLEEMKTYSVNSAKWEAAERYCEKKSWKFLKITEDHIRRYQGKKKRRTVRRRKKRT